MVMLPAWAMTFVPIEGASDAHWKSLAQKLKELQSGKSDRPLNILQLGDSHTAGEYWSERLRQRFQTAYGVGGVGFLPPGIVKDHPVYQARVFPGAQWVAERDKSGARNSGVGSLGLGGYVGYGTVPYQTVIYEIPKSANVSRLYVYSSGSSGGRGFKLFADGTEVAPNAAPEKARPVGRAAFDVVASGKRLTLLVRDSEDGFRLLGITGVSKAGGVTFSSIGVIGATLDVLAGWDSAVTREQIKDYSPALLILAFGTNDVVSTDFSGDKFSESLRRTADWVRRNAPDSAVLFVMPPRAPGLGPRGTQNLDTARLMIRVASRQNHWRVWDWSMLTENNCISSCQTPDAVTYFRGDGIHLTKAGYEATADALFEAIVVSDKHF